MKYKRQGQVMKIITEQKIRTHEQLIEELRKAGYDATQATVSRDIKELGLIKTPFPDGNVYYTLPSPAANEAKDHLDIFSDMVYSVASALHTVVLKTYPGMAPAAAVALDKLIDAEVLGTLAGDDTVLVITSGEEAALNVAARLRRMLKG